MEDSVARLISRINHFVLERDWNQFHSVKNIVTSISIEAAELSEIIQWSNPDVSELMENEDLKIKFGEELSDVMIYCLRLFSILGLEPISTINNKISKNEQKYPVELSKGRSTKYSELRSD
jgi:dCTP diphosphatase